MTGSGGDRTGEVPGPRVTGRRLALVLATGEYDDPALAGLRAPAGDAATLRDVLADTAVGGFEVTSVLDQDAHVVRLAVEEFLTDRRPDDLLLVYLSCHGLVDLRQRLYFAARDTRRDRLASSGVASHWILEQLEDCRARRQVVILDCCFSGAFAAGGKGPADRRDLGLGERLLGQGRGRVVLTASRATEYSFEGDSLDPPDVGAQGGSVFTRALLDGIRSGAADTDGDGWISVDDAYAFAYDRVSADGAAQTPQRWLYGAEGSILLARNPHAPQVEPASSGVDQMGVTHRIVEPDHVAAKPSEPSGRRAALPAALGGRTRVAALASAVLAVLVAVVLLVALRPDGSGDDGSGDDGSGDEGSGLTAADGSASPSTSAGILAGDFSASGPWRLVVGDIASGHDPGCTIQVQHASTEKPVRSFEGVYARSVQIQMRLRGRFRLRVSSDQCLVRAHGRAGEANLPFDLTAGQGDSDAFNTDGEVAVSATFPTGVTSCEVILRAVADGHPVFEKELQPQDGEVLLDPGGPAPVFFSDLACNLAVRKPS